MHFFASLSGNEVEHERTQIPTYLSTFSYTIRYVRERSVVIDVFNENYPGTRLEFRRTGEGVQ